jgi:2-(1,2-epoxy-1,2-dihydrophenyl)acetyl-CoA isomerase
MTVTVATDGGICTVAMTARVNGLTTQVRRALLEAFEGPAIEPGVRAVVLRGEGRTFCVGQDLAEHAARLDVNPSTALDVVADEYAPIVRAIRSVAVPVVAGVNGAAAGAGIGLALCADVVVMSDAARLSFAFTGVGLAADTGLHATLTDAVGARRARALLLLNAPLSAAEAAACGLADVVSDDFETALATVAHDLASGPTAAYAAIKRIVSTDLEPTLDAEAHEQTLLGETVDHAGAVSAFLAKQPATFSGR